MLTLVRILNRKRAWVATRVIHSLGLAAWDVDRDRTASRIGALVSEQYSDAISDSILERKLDEKHRHGLERF